MGNPFDKIGANSASVGGVSSSGTSSLKKSYEQNLQMYASIYDEYQAATAGFRSISTDISAEMEEEVSQTEKDLADKLAKEQKKAAWISLGTSLASALPSILNAISTAKTLKSGGVAGAAASQVANMGTSNKTKEDKIADLQAKLSSAEEESRNCGYQIDGAEAAKKEALGVKTEQETESSKQQGLVDKYAGEEKTLSTQISAKDTEISTAEQALSDAQNKSYKKTEIDPTTGKQKEVEDSAAKQKAVSEAEAKVQQLKQEKQELEAKKQTATDNKNAAQEAKRVADEAVTDAKQDIADASAAINDLVPKKQRLDSSIKTLKTELATLQNNNKK